MWVRLEGLHGDGELPGTHGGVVRPGRGIDVRPLAEDLGRAAGKLLGTTRMSDVVDAALVLLAADGDEMVTLDTDDIETLAESAGRHVEVVRP